MRCLAAAALAYSAALATGPAPAVADDREVLRQEAPPPLLADGREAVLAGILLPGVDGVVAGGLAALAAAALEALRADGIRAVAGEAHDRHGRPMGRLETADGLWVQAALVEAGLARVAPRPELDGELEALLAAEAEARRARRGLWAEPAYRIRAPEELDGLEGSFQIVEGRVLRASPQRRYVYLDLGPDWRRDFAVRLRRGDARRLLPLPAEDVVGRNIRVRGWVFRYFGPGIQMTSRAQLQLLD